MEHRSAALLEEQRLYDAKLTKTLAEQAVLAEAEDYEGAEEDSALREQDLPTSGSESSLGEELLAGGPRGSRRG